MIGEAIRVGFFGFVVTLSFLMSWVILIGITGVFASFVGNTIHAVNGITED